MARRYPTNVPDRWGAEKLSKIRGWWNDGVKGNAVRVAAEAAIPGIEPTAHFGFIANAGWSEDTATAVEHAPFHELGAYGTTGGPWNVPAPSCDRSKENDWCDFHDHADVRRILGVITGTERSASMSSWRDAADQAAIGAVMLHSKISGVSGALDARLRPTDESGIWATALSFGGWSAGPPTMARHVNAFAAELAQVPEAERWNAFLQALARGVQAGSTRSGASHRFAVYTATRTAQKLRAARMLAEALGRDTSWYGPVDTGAEDVIARAAGGASSSGPSSPSPDGEGALEDSEGAERDGEAEDDSTGTVAAVLLLLALLGGGYVLWRRTREPQLPSGEP